MTFRCVYPALLAILVAECFMNLGLSPTPAGYAALAALCWLTWVCDALDAQRYSYALSVHISAQYAEYKANYRPCLGRTDPTPRPETKAKGEFL